MEYVSNNQKQTEEIAAEFAKTLKSGDVVILSGDLGAGKRRSLKGWQNTLIFLMLQVRLTHILMFTAIIYIITIVTVYPQVKMRKG